MSTIVDALGQFAVLTDVFDQVLGGLADLITGFVGVGQLSSLSSAAA